MHNDRAQSEVLGIRIARDNRELLAAAAAKSGAPLSSWARDVLLDVARATLDHDARTPES